MALVNNHPHVLGCHCFIFFHAIVLFDLKLTSQLVEEENAEKPNNKHSTTETSFFNSHTSEYAL